MTDASTCCSPPITGVAASCVPNRGIEGQLSYCQGLDAMSDRSAQKKTEENGRTVTEFQYGKFQRVISLPTRIQNTNVTAEYQNGILNLTLPKTTEEKNKVVKKKGSYAGGSYESPEDNQWGR